MTHDLRKDSYLGPMLLKLLLNPYSRTLGVSNKTMAPNMDPKE